jgi:hypothetical protein
MVHGALAMSMKLVTKIKDIKGIPGKYKRVLEAWAAFANHDGTNIFASKESVASKAGISKWTVFRNTDDLVAISVLQEAQSHTCKTEECDKGAWHYAGNGHYTRAYNIGVAELQNATQLAEKLSSKMLLGQGSKMPKSKVAKSHATQSLGSTQAEQTRSVLTDGELVSKLVSSVDSSLRSSSTTPPPAAADVGGSKEESGLHHENADNAQWAKEFMANPKNDEFYWQTVCPLEDAFGISYWTDEHAPQLNRIVRWAREWGKDGEYLAALYLWTQSHRFWKTRVLGLDSFAKLLWNQTEKGLVAQYNRGVAAKERAQPSKAMTPMLVARKNYEGEVTRTIGRKPLTKAERRELLDILDRPKTNREYIMGFLAQDSCPKCHGEDSHCDCVMTEEVIVMGKSAWTDAEPLDAPPPVPATPPPEPEPEPVLCVHGWNPRNGTCWECTHPPNRKCAGCGKMFWVLPGERTQSFCTTPECGEAHHQKTRDEGVRAGLAQPVGTKHHLAAFLEGEEQ